MEKNKSKRITINKIDLNKDKKMHKLNIFKLILIIMLLMIIAPLLLIILYPIIILFILILLPIALICIIFKGKNGKTIGVQLNFDLNNASLIDTHKNKEIKEGIDNILEYTKKIKDKEKDY